MSDETDQLRSELLSAGAQIVAWQEALKQVKAALSNLIETVALYDEGDVGLPELMDAMDKGTAALSVGVHKLDVSP